ncbi:MAG: transglycosylase SLT domain-containing protein, partial [Candidatus Binataceae bacterium]
TVDARQMFGRVISEFPHSSYAPAAMFAAGRTWEDDHQLDQARSEYQLLVARYPSSKAAGQARFRIPWTLYMTKRYAEAARWFAAARPHAASPSDRAKFEYWQARALEKNGKIAAARGIFRKLALSSATNYYPALASLRCGVRLTSLPATFASAPSSSVAPEVTDESARFHLARALALRELGLRDLEPAELLALEPDIGANPQLRNFVLGELIAAGAYYDSIVAASRLEKHGRLSPLTAERVRYPVAFPDLIITQAESAGVAPFLVLALTRQESLFNPTARSVSDARGLMQLLPKTAIRVADDPGSTLNLYSPELNVRLGVTLLKKLLVMFNGNRFKAVAAYNAGKNAVARWNAQFPGDNDAWVENIGYHETRDYVKKVIGNVREYELLYPENSAAPGRATAHAAAGKTARGPGA